MTRVKFSGLNASTTTSARRPGRRGSMTRHDPVALRKPYAGSRTGDGEAAKPFRASRQTVGLLTRR